MLFRLAVGKETGSARCKDVIYSGPPKKKLEKVFDALAMIYTSPEK